MNHQLNTQRRDPTTSTVLTNPTNLRKDERKPETTQRTQTLGRPFRRFERLLLDDNQPQTTRNTKTQKTTKTRTEKSSCLRDKTFRRFFQVDRQLNTQSRNPNRPKTSDHSNLRKDKRKSDTTQDARGETRLDVLNDFYETTTSPRQNDKTQKTPKIRHENLPASGIKPSGNFSKLTGTQEESRPNQHFLPNQLT